MRRHRMLRAFSPILLGGAMLATTSTSSADRLVEREHAHDLQLSALAKAVAAKRGVPRGPRPPSPGALARAFDAEHAKHDITLDPTTGVVTAILDLRLHANGGTVPTVGLQTDFGIAVTTATTTGRTITIEEVREGYVELHMTPPLSAGQTVEIHVQYGGTLPCTKPPRISAMCSKGTAFSVFRDTSIFPWILDPEQLAATTFDGLTRELVLRVPQGTDVVAWGDRGPETIEDGRKVSRWSMPKAYARRYQLYAFLGTLGLKQVPNTPVPTTLVFPAPETAVDTKLVEWSTSALDFLGQTAKLPFQSLSLVRLPAVLDDFGTASYGMTLLSDDYGSLGDVLYEETWVHENSHLIWGVMVPESNVAESTMMSEGMATLMQIDYSYGRHFATEDRDLYIARRFLPVGLDLRTLGKDMQPIALAPDDDPPFATNDYTLWAYYRPAATLDHLRVTIGEDVFRKGLATYIEQCSHRGCRPDDLRIVLEEASGKDLRPFFERWVTGTERPKVNVSFTPTEHGVDLEVTKPDAKPMTLEMWIRLENGELTRQLVNLGGETSKVHLETASAVRSVAPSPRHDLLVDSASTVAGDLDFDGESDGLDILMCARSVGATYKASLVGGLWELEPKFKPRCDVNGDYKIDDADIALLSESFGTLRAR